MVDVSGERFDFTRRGESIEGSEEGAKGKRANSEEELLGPMQKWKINK